MRNYIAPGRSIDLVAGEGETYVAGQGYVKGSIFGVAANNASEGETVTLHLQGIYSFPGVGSVGDVAFWDNVGKDVQASATGAYAIGTIVGSAGSVRQVRLDGVAVTPVPAPAG